MSEGRNTGLVSSWREAMEGVPAGPWQMKDFDTELSVSTMSGSAPLIADLVEQGDAREFGLWGSEYQIGEWIARCSPSGISALLDALESTSRALSEAWDIIEKERATVEMLNSDAGVWHRRAETATRQRDEALAALEMAKRVLREAANHTIGPVYLSITEGLTALRDATWSIRSALENGPEPLADATKKDPGTEQREAGR